MQRNVQLSPDTGPRCPSTQMFSTAEGDGWQTSVLHLPPREPKLAQTLPRILALDTNCSFQKRTEIFEDRNRITCRNLPI